MTDGIALPRDFSRRYGAGSRRAISFGGGGVFFVAWQLAWLRGLDEAGVNLRNADRLIGTSAGSLTATAFAARRARKMLDEISLLARVPALVTALAPAESLSPSRQRAREMFAEATDSEPATITRIGQAALAAVTPPTATMRRNIGMVVRVRRWPAQMLNITCVDTYTGERCVVTEASNVRVTNAIAASSAVPGIFPPQPISDRKCMDGGVSGTGLHLDLAAGAERVLALALRAHQGDDAGGMTKQPGGGRQEQQDLRDSGSELLVVGPREYTLEDLMTATSVEKALAMGREQGIEDADRVREFWFN